MNLVYNGTRLLSPSNSLVRESDRVPKVTGSIPVRGADFFF